MEPIYRPKSTLRRALLPVCGGIAFFALLGLATWGIAALMSRNTDQVQERLAATTFEVGDAGFLSGEIADAGPLLFQGLVGDQADRSIVVDHRGDLPTKGWRVRWAFPADRDDACKVSQVKGTATFTDCEGRTLTVDDLARPETVQILLVGNTVVIDLRSAKQEAERQDAATTTAVTTTTGG